MTVSLKLHVSFLDFIVTDCVDNFFIYLYCLQLSFVLHFYLPTFIFYPAAVNVAFTLRLLKETWSDDLKKSKSPKAVSLTNKIIDNVRFSTISVLVYLLGICIAMSLTIP